VTETMRGVEGDTGIPALHAAKVLAVSGGVALSGRSRMKWRFSIIDRLE